jgi:hypothetical protein
VSEHEQDVARRLLEARNRRRAEDAAPLLEPGEQVHDSGEALFANYARMYEGLVRSGQIPSGANEGILLVTDRRLIFQQPGGAVALPLLEIEKVSVEACPKTIEGVKTARRRDRPTLRLLEAEMNNGASFRFLLGAMFAQAVNDAVSAARS